MYLYDGDVTEFGSWKAYLFWLEKCTPVYCVNQCSALYNYETEEKSELSLKVGKYSRKYFC